jgi:hypothetical protein
MEQNIALKDEKKKLRQINGKNINIGSGADENE